jgi:hypothetical protein
VEELETSLRAMKDSRPQATGPSRECSHRRIERLFAALPLPRLWATTVLAHAEICDSIGNADAKKARCKMMEHLFRAERFIAGGPSDVRFPAD